MAKKKKSMTPRMFAFIPVEDLFEVRRLAGLGSIFDPSTTLRVAPILKRLDDEVAVLQADGRLPLDPPKLPTDPKYRDTSPVKEAADSGDQQSEPPKPNVGDALDKMMQGGAVQQVLLQPGKAEDGRPNGLVHAEIGCAWPGLDNFVGKDTAANVENALAGAYSQVTKAVEGEQSKLNGRSDVINALAAALGVSHYHRKDDAALIELHAMVSGRVLTAVSLVTIPEIAVTVHYRPRHAGAHDAQRGTGRTIGLAAEAALAKLRKDAAAHALFARGFGAGSDKLRAAEDWAAAVGVDMAQVTLE